MWARASPIIFEVSFLLHGPFYLSEYKFNNTKIQDRTPLKLLSIYLFNNLTKS